MFEQYSERALRVVFLARLIAGQKGAPAIGVEHLVEGLICEDQGEIARAIGIPPEQLAIAPAEKEHPPFFSAEAASHILSKVEQSTPSSKPIDSAVDMAVSPALGKVFEAASALRSEMQQNKVEPLHLLAAVLSDTSNLTSGALAEAGITREAVIAAIRNL